MASTREPKTLQQAILFFADYENCRKAVEAIRWPDGVVRCPNCGSHHVTYLESARLWKCYAKHPKAKFSLKVGTIFEDSPIPLQKWLPALWLLTNCKNGISSYELARALGVTQTTAWFMLSRLRLALQDDQTGGKLSGKVAVMLLDRHGKDGTSQMRLTVAQGRSSITSVRSSTSTSRLARPSTPMRTCPTREFNRDCVHNVIGPAECYVDGNVHTNGCENFWSLLKRAIKGTYVSIEPFHLFRYLDEQCCRFNNRATDDAARFALALKGIVNKRLTYVALTGSELPQRC